MQQVYARQVIDARNRTHTQMKRLSKKRNESLNEGSLMNLIKFEMFTSVQKNAVGQQKSPTHVKTSNTK